MAMATGSGGFAFSFSDESPAIVTGAGGTAVGSGKGKGLVKAKGPGGIAIAFGREVAKAEGAGGAAFHFEDKGPLSDTKLALINMVGEVAKTAALAAITGEVPKRAPKVSTRAPTSEQVLANQVARHIEEERRRASAIASRAGVMTKSEVTVIPAETDKDVKGSHFPKTEPARPAAPVETETTDRRDVEEDISPENLELYIAMIRKS